MRFRIESALVFALLSSGCATLPPFPDAVQGRSYSIAEFERALVAEKVSMSKSESSRLQTPPATSENEVRLAPFVVRQFPRWSEWLQMKQRARAGDEVREYHHRLYLKQYDGPAVSMRRGFALVRNGRAVDFVWVDRSSEFDY